MHAITRATSLATPAPIGDFCEERHAAINHAHMGLAMGMLGCPTVERIAQAPREWQGEWQRLAVAEQARRAALSG